MILVGAAIEVPHPGSLEYLSDQFQDLVQAKLWLKATLFWERSRYRFT